MQLEGLKGFLPIDTGVVDDRPGLWWLDMHDARLAEPFFQQTVERFRLEHPERSPSFAEFHVLPQLEKSFESIKPTGFIFHSSRCGSTLLSNAVRTVNDSIVISEANAVDQLVARFITDDEPREVKRAIYSVLLRAVVAAFGQKLKGNEQQLIIKFSCSSVARLDQILRIWPNVPWLFVYRDPLETIVSNLTSPPGWLLDNDRRVLASLNNLTSTAIAAMDMTELCARSIGSFYSIASRLANRKSMLLNYAQLSDRLMLGVLKFFGIAPTDTEKDSIALVTKSYSKDNTGRTFEADSPAKRQQASSRVREMAAKWSYPYYEALESKRQDLERVSKVD